MLIKLASNNGLVGNDTYIERPCSLESFVDDRMSQATDWESKETSKHELSLVIHSIFVD